MNDPRGDTAAILESASPVWREALREVVRDLNDVVEGGPLLDGENWAEVPAIAALVEMAAWARLALRLHGEGVGLKKARVTAAVLLGLNDESLERKLRRAKERLKEDVASYPPPAAAG